MTLRKKWIRAYLYRSGNIWNRLPASWRGSSPARAYGKYLHLLVRRYGERRQSYGTFFLRNRAELELLRSLLVLRAHGSRLDLSILACSKGAEVYSFLWAIRSTRPDLRVSVRAVDVSQEVLEFAERGVYSLDNRDTRNPDDITRTADMNWKDQPVAASIFERMTQDEVDAMFEVEGNQARIRPSLKQGITWLQGDASDPKLVGDLGPQDIVVANRFLCHMEPAAAEKCLRNLVGLVKPGGYLFVYGVDLDVRATVARDLGWKPVPDMVREVYEGDVSLRNGWPFEYWGLEPFSDRRPDWRLRCASVFQIGEAPRCEAVVEALQQG